MSEILLDGVTYIHGRGTPYEVRALDNVSIKIPDGKITGIIGHTGSGKSTLVQLFNGLLEPHSGKVTIDGEDIWAKPKEIRKYRFKVGLVMQYPEYQLFEETIRKDIAFGPSNMGLSESQIEERVAEAAEFVGLDAEMLDKSPFDLSGGQKRRAAIAGIIAMRPDILVLDEPAAGLDPGGREAIFSNISDYQRKTGRTVVIVSHSMEDMARFCDELVVMSDSKVIMHDTPEGVFSRPDILVENGLDVPQITRLCMLLERKGVDLGGGIFTVDRAFERIMQKKNS